MTLEIAQRLTALRKERGYSQEELAQRLNISMQAVSKWERAEASPDTDNLIALAQLYGVSLDEMIYGARTAQQEDAPASAPQPEETIDVDDAGDAVDPDDPLPYGSYYEDRRCAEEERREARRRRFPYPVLVTALYLLMGVFLNWWHPGWIIFMTIPLYYLRPADRAYHRLLFNPIMVTIIYLLLGFGMGWWHPGWIIFLLIPLGVYIR